MTENAVAEEKATDAKVEVSEKLQKIIDQIETLTVLELSELVKALEDKFGVTAAAPMAMGGMMMPGAGGEEAAKEEKTSFDVILERAGDKKIAVIKEVRAITGLGLKEAKALVDASPKAVKEGLTQEEADKVKDQLEAVGAIVEIK